MTTLFGSTVIKEYVFLCSAFVLQQCSVLRTVSVRSYAAPPKKQEVKLRGRTLYVTPTIHQTPTCFPAYIIRLFLSAHLRAVGAAF